MAPTEKPMKRKKIKAAPGQNYIAEDITSEKQEEIGKGRGHQATALLCRAGVYILENTPLGGEYQPMSFGRKNMKRLREKG